MAFKIPLLLLVFHSSAMAITAPSHLVPHVSLQPTRSQTRTRRYTWRKPKNDSLSMRDFVWSICEWLNRASKHHVHNWCQSPCFHFRPLTGCTSYPTPLLSPQQVLQQMSISVHQSLSISLSQPPSLSPLVSESFRQALFSVPNCLKYSLCNFLSFERSCCMSAVHSCHPADGLNKKLPPGGTRMGTRWGWRHCTQSSHSKRGLARGAFL